MIGNHIIEARISYLSWLIERFISTTQMLNKVYPLLLLVIAASSSIMAQGSFHPETYNPGCCSEKTRLPFTNSRADKELFLIYEGNKTSEKSMFYHGKYDPYKTHFNKRNPLFNQLYIIPPATLPISKGIFLDQTEVSIIDYQEFLHYIELDSGKYRDKEYEPTLDNKYLTKYIGNPEFYYYPVTGVNHEHAQAYCEWRAQKLNVLLKEMLVGSPKKYRYRGRLPNLAEWQKAAGDPIEHIEDVHYTLGKNELKFLEDDIIPNRFAVPAVLDQKEIYSYNANFYVDPPMGLEIEIPAYIYSFEPNERGFYNMFGNVKELIEEGYAIGGSFKTPYDPATLFVDDHDVQAYKMDVGFRCICEVAKRKL